DRSFAGSEGWGPQCPRGERRAHGGQEVIQGRGLSGRRWIRQPSGSALRFGDPRAAVETRPNFREDSTVLDDPDTTDLSCAPTLDNRSPPKRRLQRLRCVLIENSASRTKPVMVPIWPSRLQARAISCRVLVTPCV